MHAGASKPGASAGLPLTVTLLGLLLLVGACSRTATQLTVVVDSDLSPGTELRYVRAHAHAVGGSQDATTHTVEVTGGAATGAGMVTLPFSFGVVSRGGRARPVEVRLEAFDRDPGTSASPLTVRTARTTFLPGANLGLPLFLWRNCIDVDCSAQDLTCIDGRCQSPDVPRESLLPVERGRELGDAGPVDPRDGGAPADAGLPMDAGDAGTMSMDTGTTMVDAAAADAGGADAGPNPPPTDTGVMQVDCTGQTTCLCPEGANCFCQGGTSCTVVCGASCTFTCIDTRCTQECMEFPASGVTCLDRVMCSLDTPCQSGCNNGTCTG